jgi:hypothetical protein
MRAARRTILGTIALAAVAAGVIALFRDSRERAGADPAQDGMRGYYATGDGESLTVWKLDGGRMSEATRYDLAWQPAFLETKGSDEKSPKPEPAEVHPAGYYIFSTVFKPAPEGMAVPPGLLGRRPSGSRTSALPAPSAGTKPAPTPPPAPAATNPK